MLPLVVAAALAATAAPGPDAAWLTPAPPRAEPLRQDWDAPQQDEDESPARVRVTAWTGVALAEAGTGRGSSFGGGELGWAFDQLDVGAAGYAYRNLRDATREWAPVLVARLTQRFRTGRGVEAAFGFGVGAGRPRGWKAWYQLALGVRVPLGPVFVAGELAFEQYDLLRLGAGLGLAF